MLALLAGCATLALTTAPALAAVTVTGEVSPSDPLTWTRATSVTIGVDNFGQVDIDGGTRISARTAAIAVWPSSTGTVTVDGVDSIWSVRDEIRVGRSGSGTVLVTNGGSVAGRGEIASMPGSSGSVTIDGPGSSWTIHGLRVGVSGSGTLLIANGGMATAHAIGALSGSSGTVTVDGIGSLLTSQGDFFVGGFSTHHTAPEGGSGQLVLRNHGAAQITRSTHVGRVGNSSGGIEFDGGTLTTGSLFAAAADLTGAGTINTRGLISDVHLVFDATHGPQQSFIINDNVTVNLDLDSDEELGVGYKGSGSMTIQGRTIRSRYGYVGAHAGANGSVSVDGPDSHWLVNRYLFVGGAFPRGSHEGGDGTIQVANGAILSCEEGHVGMVLGSSGTVSVEGSGSRWLIDGNYVAYIGSGGSGTLDVSNGGLVEGRLTAGWREGSAGLVNVDGQGSEITREVIVGHSGSAILNVTNGAIVRGPVRIAMKSGSSGSVTVDGEGSRILQGARVGNQGHGSLTITSGGEVYNDSIGVIGWAAASSGNVSVDGFESKWEINNTLYVGQNGTAALSITAGGMVSNLLGFVGDGTGSSGAVNVDGFGSIWLSSLDLHVGRDGDGILTITNRGLVQVDGRLHIDPLGRGGTDYIAMDTGGMLKLLGNGAADIDAFLGLVVGSDDIRYWTGSEWDSILNATPGIHYMLSFDGSHTTLTVPEPASVVLLGVGGLALIRRKRHAA